MQHCQDFPCPPTKGVCVRKIALAATSIVLSVGLFWPTQAFAIDNVNTKKLRKAVTVSGILQHERAFQRIANETTAPAPLAHPATPRRPTTW
jgi:hypothetical protein